MKTVLICNSKGGVGKSLIADELVFSFERSGVPCSFFDLDSQGGTVHKSAKRRGAKVAVVDTPGALQEQLVEWMRQADLIVIPTRTTSRDIEPLMRMRQAAAANAACPVLYVLNCWTRWKASRDFEEWLSGQIGDAQVLKLPQSEQFVQASAYGESVVAYAPRSAAAKAMKALCNAVRGLVGIEAE